MTATTGEEILRDVLEVKRVIERDYPEGPYGIWSPETGWIMSEPGENEDEFLERIRKDSTP